MRSLLACESCTRISCVTVVQLPAGVSKQERCCQTVPEETTSGTVNLFLNSLVKKENRFKQRGLKFCAVEIYKWSIRVFECVLTTWVRFHNTGWRGRSITSLPFLSSFVLMERRTMSPQHNSLPERGTSCRVPTPSSTPQCIAAGVAQMLPGNDTVSLWAHAGWKSCEVPKMDYFCCGISDIFTRFRQI